MHCLRERLGPLAAEVHHLRAMDETLPSVGDEVGLLLAPPAQRGSPFVHSAQVEDLVAFGDDGAIDQAPDYRGGLSRCDPDHDFVEHGDAFCDLTARDEGLTSS
jgi:hypothetical protein